MNPTTAIFCCLLTFMLAVDAAPKSPWRRTKRETDPCRDNIDSCDTCENPALQCVACDGNRIISNDGYYCVECPANSNLDHCEDIGSGLMGKAKLCLDGYRLNSEENTCTACILGCKHCQTDAEYCDLNQCFPGYAYNSVSKTCTACPLRCAACSYPDIGDTNTTTTTMEITCDNCTTNAYKSGTSCLDCGVGCDTCLAEKGCTKCADGYYASLEVEGVVKCSLCGSLYSGCIKCTAEECLECASTSAQVLVDGKCQSCPTNCKTCSYSDSSVTCDECNSYFTLDANKQCVSCGQCTTCELDADMKTICKTCPEQTAVIGQAICDKCPDNCLECTRTEIATICLLGKCKTGYTRNAIGDICLKCPDNCIGGCHYSSIINGAACNDNACAAEFAVDSESGQCIACPADCSACYVESGTAYCTVGKCKLGSARNDLTKLCVKCPDKCDYCYVNSEQEPVCVECSSGTALHPVTKECLDCESNCKACSVDANGVVTCQKHQCYPGNYWNKEDGKCYGCQVPSCLYCKEESKCLECSPGFILNSDATSCISTAACLDGAVFDVDSQMVKCAQCASGWYATNTDALKSCSSCNDGCKTCNATSCLTCESEIPMVKSGTCLQLVGCQVSTLIGRQITCSKCNDGYVLVKGACHKCPRDCQTCSYNSGTGGTECISCNSGFGLTDDKTCSACPTSCSSCQTAGSCDVCQSGYVLVSGSCVACSSNCLTCSDADLCTSCQPGYVLASGVCTRCPVGTSGSLVITYCESCPADATTCSTCSYGYITTGSSDPACVACSVGGDFCELVGSTGLTVYGMCKPGYVMKADDTRTCVACPAGFTTCYITDEIVTGYPGLCKTGYVYVETDKSCQSCGTGCNHCSAPGTCKTDGCKTGYGKNLQGICGVCDPNCLSCTVNGAGKCDPGQCKVGNIFDIADNTCKPCASNCKSCATAGAGKCDAGQCDEGFVLDSTAGTCSECDSNCKSCATAGAGKCDAGQCDDGFGLDSTSETCSACASDCKSCATAGAGKCDVGQCNEGFVLDSTAETCSECASDCKSCATAGAGKCDVGQCNVGFVLDSTAETCSACDSNCKSCATAGAGKCDAGQCDDGFGLDSTSETCSACDSNCASCSNNGATKCDPGQCNAGYSLDPTSLTCKRIRCKDPDGAAPYYHGQVHPDHECDIAVLSSLDGCQFYVFGEKDSKVRFCPEDFCQAGYVWKSADQTSKSGYKLGTCDACPDGCLNCIVDGSSTVCLPTGCAQNYAIKPDGTCAACPDHCDECEWDQTTGIVVCKDGMCATGYSQPSADTCIDCPATVTSCALINAELTSKLCGSGFVKTSEGICFSCSDNCEVCTIDENTATTMCQTCQNGYVKDVSGRCQQCPTACTDCTYDATKSMSICKLGACQEGYIQDQTTMECSACPISNCLSCFNNGSCVPGGCGQGYYSVYQNGHWECVNCITNCLHCDNSLSCLPEGCMDGFVRNSAGECIECGTGCQECKLNADNSVTCVVCSSTHAPKIVGSVITECVACSDGCQSCSYQEDISTTSCDVCLDPYYEQTQTVGSGQQQYCTACGDNVLKCSSVGGTKFIETCASGTGKYPEDGASATDCKACPTNCASCTVSSTCTQCNEQDTTYYLTGGVCYNCPANCVACKSSETSPGCYTCAVGYRRYKDVDDHYKCQKCTDPNCLTCDDDVAKCTKCATTHYLNTDQCVACSTDLSCIDCSTDGVCKTCRSGTYLTEEKTCLACPGNCAACDATGCIRCNDEWLINKGQCGNCPFHCKQCTMDSGSQILKCDSNQCYDGYGLDASKYSCIDCATLTGVAKCVSCTDVDPATNKSTCLSCEGPRYTLDENNATCLDCNAIDSCGACIDRPRICASCINDLETNRNKTICGAMCYRCLGDGCPENPTEDAVDYITLDLVFCPEYCIVRTKWEYSGSGSEREKVKILHREYGCSGDIGVNVAGADGCRQDNKNCATDSEDYEVCCYKGYKNFNSGASALAMISLSTLLMLMATVQLLMN